MHCKLFVFIAIGLLSANARVVRKKFCQRVAAPSCATPLPTEPTYGCYGSCNCQSVFLNELSNCGCQYMETYGVLNPEMPNCGRVSAINLPKMPVASCGAASIASFDAVMPIGGYEVLPAINLPGLCEVLPYGEYPMAFQFAESCECGIQNSILELPNPILKCPSESCIQAPKCLPQAIQLPSCGCQNMPCSCQDMPCSCQNMPCTCQNTPCRCQNAPCRCQNAPCSCQNMPCSCQNTPCSCQNMPCTCQNMPYSYQNMPCGCQNVPCTCKNTPCGCQNVPCTCKNTPCGCQNMPCSCQNMAYSCQNAPYGCQNMPYECQNCKYEYQNVYVSQLPAVELSCGCQSCQLSPVEVPVYGCCCQSLPPPVIGCGGKYLRQVTIQPPFL